MSLRCFRISLRSSSPTNTHREDALMTANNNVTEALQRTLGLMQGELEKSVLSTQLLGTTAPPLSLTHLFPSFPYSLSFYPALSLSSMFRDPTP